MFGYEEPAAEVGAGAPLARAAVTDNTALPIAPRMVVVGVAGEQIQTHSDYSDWSS